MTNPFDKFGSIFESMVSLCFIYSTSSSMYFKGVEKYNVCLLVVLTC